jgi:hypothetical protein
MVPIDVESPLRRNKQLSLLELVALFALVCEGCGPLSVEHLLSKTATASAMAWPPSFLNYASIRHREAPSHQVAASRRFQEKVRSRREESKRLPVQRCRQELVSRRAHQLRQRAIPYFSYFKVLL